MAVKRIRTNLSSDLMRESFTNTPSNTLFSFGGYELTTNDEDRIFVDNTKKLTSFVKPITLETLEITEEESVIVEKKTNSVVLNLDNRDLRTFVRFGSSYEYLRVCVENIIKKFPYSFSVGRTGSKTIEIVSEDTYQTTYKIAKEFVDKNKSRIVVEGENLKLVGSGDLIPFDRFDLVLENNKKYQLVKIKENVSGGYNITVKGKPFENDSIQSYHIKPNKKQIAVSHSKMSDYERYLVSNRDDNSNFIIVLKEPTLFENGEIVYINRNIVWYCTDGYNIDIDSPRYGSFLETILTIGGKYDATKTDLITRFLTPQSLKLYDTSDDGKMSKLLRLYGREFDEVRKFIDSLVYINKISYDKINNIPDILIKNLANTVGWEYFNLINDDGLIDSLFTTSTESDSKLPVEIDIELWRRIIINTNYLWKSKGTRDSILAILLMVGIPEDFINITEYVYTVGGKINPNSASLEDITFPNNSNPFDEYGYPKAPIESNDFYFQIAGNSDGGEEYMDVFRNAGFNLTPVADNRKSWVEEGNVIRRGDNTPQYEQMDSKLVLNTKAINVSLDISQGIEKDVFDYIRDIDITTDSGYTRNMNYINISLGYGSGSHSEIKLPENYNIDDGDIEVRFNGMLLLRGVSGSTESDYYIVDGYIKFQNNENKATNLGNKRDVIQVTYATHTEEGLGFEAKYIVTKAKVEDNNTYISVDEIKYSSGDIQLTLNGIALTKDNDFVYDVEHERINIINNDVKLYLDKNPVVQLAFLSINENEENKYNLRIKNEYHRVTSLNSNKFYKNTNINKFVYKLNYKVNSTKDVKILINGIMLEPNIDYSLNPDNPYEIFLPSGIKYGHVVHAYYFIDDGGEENPMIDKIFELGDINELSFLEFIEKIKTTLINVRNRKTMSDFKGGWYPNLLRLYEIYFRRSALFGGSGLQSNGFTYNMIYPFLSKYNNIFEKFIDELLPATIIIRGGGGFVIRNNVFTQQKYTYKRGVTLFKTTQHYDNDYAQYLGDDGSMFRVLQPEVPAPIDYCVDTIEGKPTINSIIETGGQNICGYESVMKYGMEYREVFEDETGGKETYGGWVKTNMVENQLTNNWYSVDEMPLDVSGFKPKMLKPNTKYQYRVYMETKDGQIVRGDVIEQRTLEIVTLQPFGIETIKDEFVIDQTINTGGIISGDTAGLTEYGIMYVNLTPTTIPTKPKVTTGYLQSWDNHDAGILTNKFVGEGVDEYGLEFRKVGDIDFVKQPAICDEEGVFHMNLTGLTWGTEYLYRAYATNDVGMGVGVVRSDLTTRKPSSPKFILGGSGSNKYVGVKIENTKSDYEYDFVIEYKMIAFFDDINGNQPNVYGNITFEYSIDDGANWSDIVSVGVGGIGSAYDDYVDIRVELFNIKEVKSENISKLRFRLNGIHIYEDYEIGANLQVRMKEIIVTNTGDSNPETNTINVNVECVGQTKNNFSNNRDDYIIGCSNVL